MASWKRLIDEIVQVIKENGNNEITGNILQEVLVAMVNALGENWRYGGVAKLTTKPRKSDGPQFYFANTVGKYPNFANVEMKENGLAVIRTTDTGWILEHFYR